MPRFSRRAAILAAIAGVVLVRGDVRAGQSDAAPTIVDRGAFLSPPADMRPAVRWWWPGGDVDDHELAREIDVMSGAGFGAAEIQSFAVGLPANAAPAVKTFGTSAWFDHVGAALTEAQRVGLKVDLTAGSSWPTGGDDVAAWQSLQQLIPGATLVNGPGVLDAAFPGPVEPVRYSFASQLLGLPDTFNAAQMTPVAVFAVRLDADQTQPPQSPPALPSLPALAPTTFLDASSVIDLGPFVNGNRIQWTIPDGSWLVFAFHRGPTGLQPFWGADPNGGLVMDHLNAPAVSSHLATLMGTAQSRFGAPFAGTLRSLFVDSLELRSELYWTDDFLTEFAARRGYRLEPFLPVLFVPFKDDAYLRNLYPNASPQFDMRDAGARVRHDYDVTVSELIVERFFATIGQWGAANGFLSRVQAHGAPADLLNAYQQASIPESEGLYAGGQPSFVRYAASAAHINGSALVSSEVFAKHGGDATPGDMIREADRVFAAGVNHVVMHGFPYVYMPGFSPQGWMPFQSPLLPGAGLIGTFGTRLNDMSVFWRFLPALNARLARTQLVLRTGTPVAHIALYSDRIGYPDDPTLAPDVNQQLERAGENYDYVNADLLGPATLTNGALQVGASTYSALVFDHVTQMPVEVAGRVAQLAQSGLPIVFVGDVPQQQPGYLNAAQNDPIVRGFFEQLFGQTRDQLVTQAKVRSGSAIFIASSGDLPGTLAGDLGIVPDLILDDNRDSLHFAHRRTADADYYFVTSSNATPIDALVSFGHDASRTPYAFDLPTGGVAVAPVYSVISGRTVVPMHLEPGDAVMIGFEPAGPIPPTHLDATNIPQIVRSVDGGILLTAQFPGTYSVTLNGQTANVTLGNGVSLPAIDVPVWDLVTLGSPATGTPTQAFPSITLSDLSTVPQLQGFTGTAIYSSTVAIDPAYFISGTRLVLVLGQVYDTADVKVNGRSVTTLAVGPFETDITSFITPGLNRIEVGVTIEGSPAGLIGPVTLIPMYQSTLSALQPVTLPPVPFSTVVTPANFPNSNNDDMLAAITQASQIAKHVNFQWFWKTPPNGGNADGTVVGCEQVGPWVAAAKAQGLGVTLQFQTFVTKLTAANTAPIVEIANPILPFDQASFSNSDLATAYLNEITCLAGLEPDYLVLGPEMNFVVSFNFAEYQNYLQVYKQAYDIVKAVSPWTQVGLSWQYDGLRNSLPLDSWNYIGLATPQDFIGLTTYFGYSPERFLAYPTVSSIPADYYSPIRARFGPNMPIMFTEVGYSSLFPNGLTAQADFVRRLPALMQNVHPVAVVWALSNDVNYFVGPSGSLNMSGLIATNGVPKPAWNAVVQMRSDKSFVDVVPHVVAPAPMPFTVTGSPALFPTVVSDDLNIQALVEATQVGGHVSLQFEWRDHITGQVWDCASVKRYTDLARQLGVRYTVQFSTYAALPSNSPDGSPRIVMLNPILPMDTSSGQTGPSITDPRILPAYIQQVQCLAGLGEDYLVLGPEINFLIGSWTSEYFAFSSAYQLAYAVAKAVSPRTQIGTSYQYDALRNELLEVGYPPWYLAATGPQDFLGLTSYFGYSDDLIKQYPSPTSIPSDYYVPIRALAGSTPIVFTEIGWPSWGANGAANQVMFLNRLPSLMQPVQPANVIWALEHDVINYFPPPVDGLGSIGLLNYDGSAKLAWWQALRLKQTGLFVTPQSIGVP